MHERDAAARIGAEAKLPERAPALQKRVDDEQRERQFEDVDAAGVGSGEQRESVMSAESVHLPCKMAGCRAPASSNKRVWCMIKVIDVRGTVARGRDLVAESKALRRCGDPTYHDCLRETCSDIQAPLGMELL